MIRSFTVTNPSGNSLMMELENPKKSGFFVAGITGLGPPKADINTTRRAGSDGSIYNSAKVESRNIVITLIYYTDNTAGTDGQILDVEALRQRTYKFFPIKRQVTLHFITDRRRASITGYVESNEIGFFTNMEGSQISIVCNDPWFISEDVGVTNLRLINTEPLLTFPIYFDEETAENRDHLEFSRKKSRITGNIPYYGDLETGFSLTVACKSATGDIALSNDTHNETITISSETVRKLTGSLISSGDRIVVTTHTGNKTAKLFRGSTVHNIIAAVNKQSKWLKLYSGNNELSATPTTGRVEVSIDLKVLYEGM